MRGGYESKEGPKEAYERGEYCEADVETSFDELGATDQSLKGSGGGGKVVGELNCLCLLS